MIVNVPSMDNPVCQKCGLWEGKRHPFQGMEGNGINPTVLVVAEAP